MPTTHTEPKTMTYSNTQQKVLAGMAVATAATFQEHRERIADGTIDFPIVGALLGAREIALAARLGEVQTIRSLASLVKRGDVIPDRLVGMGGALMTYKLSEQLRDAALARYGQEPVR